MTTFSTKQVAIRCIATAMLTVVTLAAFWVFFWPGVRADLGLTPRVCSSDWSQPLDFEDPLAKDEVRQRYESMVALRNSVMSQEQQDSLMRLLHNNVEIYKNMYWLGIPVLKTPSDMWMMQQVLAEVRPDWIVEAGTWQGGSALYFAHVLEGLGLQDSKIITIDIEDMTEEVSKHPLWQERIEFVHGSSTDPEVIAWVKKKVAGKRVLVVLDSVHAAFHVAAEIKAYSSLVSPESYLIVEDTGLDGIPIYPNWEGPTRAVVDFLETDEGGRFEVDSSREAFMITLHPGGWLKRK